MINSLVKMTKKIGTVTHVFGKIGVAILRLEENLRVGQEIHFKGKHTDFTQTAESLQVDHQNIDEAKKGDDVGLKTSQSVQEGDEIFIE